MMAVMKSINALKAPEADHWWAAMKSEIESINEKGTWISVAR